MNAILRYFQSPEDSEPEFLALIRNVLFFTIATNVLRLVLVSGLAGAGTFNLPAAIALTLMALLQAAALVMVLRGNPYLAKVVVPFALFVTLFVVAVTGNGIHDITIIAFPLILMVGNLLAGQRAAVVVTPFAILTLVAIIITDITGINRSPFAAATGQYELMVGLLILLATAAILSMLVGRLNRNITLARGSEAELRRSNAELRDLQVSLEQRINERTAELSRSVRLAERHSAHMQAVAELSQAISTLRDVDELLPEVTRLIRNKFGYYHAGIFLNDEKNEFAVLRAASSEGGRHMLARGHRLAIGGQGIVSTAILQNQPHVAADVTADAVYFSNPDLPETRSEIALPLAIGSGVIGALDVQSEQVGAFDAEDIEMLTTLANQVSLAIQNARLFEESHQAAEALELTLARYTQGSWQNVAAATGLHGFRSTSSGIEPLAPGQKDAGDAHTLEVPVQLRGTRIGTLGIRTGRRADEFNADELAIIQSAADRVALSLENARLFAEAQRRAATERTIGEVSARLTATPDVDTILRLTVEEIGRLLGNSDVAIQLHSAPETQA